MDQIIVCIKQVPDFSRVQPVPMDRKTGAMVRVGIPSIINPLDKHALEEALRQRETLGGVVTAISMGPFQARSALEDALVMGVDRAVLLSDRSFAGADTLATSYVLAHAIQRMGPFSLVICGRESLDGGTGHIAPSLAEWLDLPHISCVRKLEIRPDRLWAQRIIDNGYQEVEGPLPMVVSVVKEINRPRPLRLREVARAASKEIALWGMTELALDHEKVGLVGSPTQVPRIYAPEPRKAAAILDGPVTQAVAELVSCLWEMKAI